MTTPAGRQDQIIMFFHRQGIIGLAASVAALVLLIVPLSCTPTGPDTNGFDDAATVAADVVAANLMPLVEKLTQAHVHDTPVSNEGYPTDDLFPSDRLTRDSVAALVSTQLSSMGYSPRTLVLGSGSHATYNVVAEWRGETSPSEVILVGAHLDAFYAGADDNTSAVAAMLEAARVIRLHRFGRTVRFVAFDLEEFGCLGSTRYVQAGYADDVRAAIVLEMLGYASDAPGSQKEITGLSLPDKGNFLFVAGNDQSAEMVQQMVALGNTRGLANLLGVIAPGDGAFFLSLAFTRSDHGLMWYKGIPALMLSDGGDFRNPYYHRPTDTPETLNPAFLAANTRAVVAAIALFAVVQP
jgi:hypothetical protein